MFTVTPVVAPCLAVMLKIPCALIPVIFCPWNREMLICSCANAPVIVSQSMKMINDIFFIIICFYDGTLKGNEKLQVFVFFLEKMRHRVTFLLGKENWSSNGYSVRIADRKK